MCKEDIISKITKLLSKTEQAGATPEEAASAIAMAHKLMAKYGVDMQDLQMEEDEVIEEDMSVGTKSVSTLQASLARSLADHFGCEIYLHTSSRTGQTIRVVGERDKASIYKATFMFAYNTFKKSWERYMKTLDCDTREKNLLRGTFFKGFVDGITNELVKQENQFGLVVVKSEKVDEHMSKIQMGGTRHLSYKQIQDATTYLEGYREGSSAQVQKHHAID